MRIGFLTSRETSNFNYRASFPSFALTDEGHQTELVFQQEDGSVDLGPLRRCDVVHVYRRCDPVVRGCVDDLQRRGIAVTWDNDDDVRLLPEASKRHIKADGLKGDQAFREQLKMLRRADLVTTTSPVLAERYREAGATRVVEIENYLHAEQLTSQLTESSRLVVGWVAGLEHHADAQALDLSATLRRLLERHPKLHVVTIGVRLDLPADRYEHHLVVPMPELKDHVRRFDIAIAPLGDIPMSYARSNVKVKEYSAAGVPWLASERGPYLGLGPSEGGLLVPDSGWEAAIDRMIGSRFQRMRLRRRARSWAKTQLMTRHADQWLAAFEEATEAAAERRADTMAAAAGRAR